MWLLANRHPCLKWTDPVPAYYYLLWTKEGEDVGNHGRSYKGTWILDRVIFLLYPLGDVDLVLKVFRHNGGKSSRIMSPAEQGD